MNKMFFKMASLKFILKFVIVGAIVWGFAYLMHRLYYYLNPRTRATPHQKVKSKSNIYRVIESLVPTLHVLKP